MPISIDWGAKRIYVPNSYLTLISGSLYKMDLNVFWADLKDLEDDEEGMPFEDTHERFASITIAGVTYAPALRIINGYTVEFEDGLYSVRLEGANTNVWSVLDGVLVQNTVQVISTNSAGLQIVSVGSGLSVAQDTSLSNIEALLSSIEGSLDHPSAMRLLLAVLAGKVSGAGTGTERFRDQADTKDRVVSTVDQDGNRSSVAVDAS
jgi:hypothetical protein